MMPGLVQKKETRTDKGRAPCSSTLFPIFFATDDIRWLVHVGSSDALRRIGTECEKDADEMVRILQEAGRMS